jgi:hypothetical protein
VFIETWRASRGLRRERLHSFMCNAFGPGGVRAQRPDARRHRSPRRNGGCVAIQGDSALRHGHVKKTGQWCTQNRATDPGVAGLGDPGRVGEKGREGLQVGLKGPGDRSHATPVEDRLNRPGFPGGSISWEDGSHGQTQSVLSGSAGACRPDGGRARPGPPLAGGGNHVDRREGRSPRRSGARPRRSVTGCGRPSGTMAGGPA